MYWKLSMLLTLVGCLCVILSCSLAPTPINSQTENQPLTAKAPAQEQAAAQKHSPEQKQNPAKQQDAIDHQSAGPEQKSVTKNQPPTEDDPGWILFRGDAKSTGVAKSALPEDLDVIWKYEVKQGAFMGTPIVVGGQPKTVYIGDADGKLFALAFDTGKLLWEFKTEIGYETAPAYKDGHIYIGDLDGVFYCLDTKGQLVWKYQTDGAIQSSANFYKDLVLFGSQDTKLYALDAKTGKKAWDLETADQVRCSATVVDRRAFVAGCDGALHSVNLDDGKEINSVVIQSPTGVTPAVLGDVAYVGTEQAGVFAIDWTKAVVKWHFNPEGSLATRSSPAVNKDHVVFGSRERRVYSLNPESGKTNWTATLKANINSSPVIVGDRVYVGSEDGRLHALSLNTGKVLWEKQLDGGILGSPAVAFGRLIIATDRGVVYCLGKKK